MRDTPEREAMNAMRIVADEKLNLSNIWIIQSDADADKIEREVEIRRAWMATAGLSTPWALAFSSVLTDAMARVNEWRNASRYRATIEAVRKIAPATPPEWAQ